MELQDANVPNIQGLMEIVSSIDVLDPLKEQQAHAAIKLNLSVMQIMHVIDTTNARDAWGRLTKFHRTQDMANRLYLNEKFALFKYTVLSISGHATELEDFLMKMTRTGCVPSEDDVRAVVLRIACMLRKLSPVFTNVRDKLGNFRDLVSKLMADEERQRQQHG